MGRPRDLDARDRILSSTYELITTPGADASINAIVSKAGVGKATVYRWWKSRTAVVLDALIDQLGPLPTPEWTDDGWADLRTRIAEIAHLFTGSVVNVTRDLFGAVLQGDEEADAIREAIIDQGERRIRDALARGQAQGVIRGDLDLDAAVDMVLGTLWSKTLATKPGKAEEVTDQIMAVLGAGWKAS